MNQFTYGILALLISTVAYGHHSTLGTFDPDQTISIEGTITDFRWSNPHVRLEVAVTDTSGNIEDWEIELSALSMLRTRGLDQEILHIGDTIQVAGNPARGGLPAMAGNNLLLMDGREVLVDRGSTPYFTDPDNDQTLQPVFDNQVAEQARDSADGIFRVWSTILDSSFPMFRGGYPLTEAAAATKESWVPDIEVQLSCWEKDMPFLMITPHPIEFVQQGEDILIRFEEDDAERRIHMGEQNQNSDDSWGPLGYSSGAWEANTLVVETANIDAAAFDDLGTPMDKNIRLTERFTLSDDQQRLDYHIRIVDPVTFTQPVDLSRYFVWRPELQVNEWNCVD
jgi:hypothetical protein